jgi:hypothetical protein
MNFSHFSDFAAKVRLNSEEGNPWSRFLIKSFAILLNFPIFTGQSRFD